MTAEQLEELMGKVTQGDWRVSERGTNTVKGGLGERIAYPDPADLTESEIAANATLIALAPSLACRVLAAEKLVEAVEIYLTGSTGHRDLARAANAYRDASK